MKLDPNRLLHLDAIAGNRKGAAAEALDRLNRHHATLRELREQCSHMKGLVNQLGEAHCAPRIAELERKIAAAQRRYDDCNDETARVCAFAGDAEKLFMRTLSFAKSEGMEIPDLSVQR